MITLPILLLKSRIKSLTLPNAATPLFKEVEYYMSQYDLREPEKQMVAVPACYIEFMDAQFDSVSGGGQYLPLSFRLHIVTLAASTLQRFSIGTSGPLAHQQVVDMAYIGIQGYQAKASNLPELASFAGTPQDFQVLNSCTRTAIYPNYDGGHIIVTVLAFKTLAFDPAAVKQYTKVLAQLSVTPGTSA